MDAGGLGRGLDILQPGVLFAVGQVVEDGAGEQPGVLEHHGVGQAQALAGDLADVGAV